MSSNTWVYFKKDLGIYFQDAIFADIDALIVYAGIHLQLFGFYRLLSKVFLMQFITKLNSNV